MKMHLNFLYKYFLKATYFIVYVDPLSLYKSRGFLETLILILWLSSDELLATKITTLLSCATDILLIHISPKKNFIWTLKGTFWKVWWRCKGGHQQNIIKTWEIYTCTSIYIWNLVFNETLICLQKKKNSAQNCSLQCYL